MKPFYFFIFFFTNGINPTKAQLHQEFSGERLLRFVFHPDYSNNEKICCKFTSYGCITFVTSNGYVHSAYKGRVETFQYPGAFDVRILNVRAGDAGIYRCEIHGPQNFIYQIFQVTGARPSKTELNPIVAVPKSTNAPVSSAHNILETHHEISSNKWSLKLTLGTIFGVVIIALIICITLTTVYYKKKSRDKCGRSFPSVPSITEQLTQDLVYTTIDFKQQQKTSIYANLDIHKSRPDSDCALKTQDSVEYATIAGVL